MLPDTFYWMQTENFGTIPSLDYSEANKVGRSRNGERDAPD
jgi:hypothetical protein